MSRCITKLLGRQARHRVHFVSSTHASRSFQGRGIIAYSCTQYGGIRTFHTSYASRSEVPSAMTSEPRKHRDRRPEADFRAVIRDFVRQNRDNYELGSHEGRMSINLHTSDPTDKSQIQKRLSFFLQAYTEHESEGGHSPLLMEIAKDIYVHLNSQIGSNICVTVEFDRTIAGNSLNSATLESLALVFESMYTVSSLRGVLLTGAAGRKAARAFSCGADIKEMQQLANADEAGKFIRRISRVCTAIRRLRVPVVCGIDGAALGAGLEIAASCDIRIATHESIFAMPEVNLAIPSVVEARLLCDIIGVGRTKHFLLTGESLDAETALNYGLITKLFEDREQLLAWSAKLFEGFCSSLNVHTEQKDLMRVWESSTIEEGIAAGVGAFANRFEGTVGREVRSHMQNQWQRLKSGRK